MKLEPGKFCPLIKEDCIGLRCHFMTHLRGTDPQTGKEVDEWFCAIAVLPMLLIENAKEVRQGAAATESFRNEMAARADLARQERLSVTHTTGTSLDARNDHP
jgi:hypothetical protein